MIITANKETKFKDSLRQAGVTVVEFGANWCPPCKVLLPILDGMDHEYGGSVTFVKWIVMSLLTMLLNLASCRCLRLLFSIMASLWISLWDCALKKLIRILLHDIFNGSMNGLFSN
jgi:thiol-disulfide isomerase/thioredoxin